MKPRAVHPQRTDFEALENADQAWRMIVISVGEDDIRDIGVGSVVLRYGSMIVWAVGAKAPSTT
jgi:hypothetical protein